MSGNPARKTLEIWLAYTACGAVLAIAAVQALNYYNLIGIGSLSNGIFTIIIFSFWYIGLKRAGKYHRSIRSEEK